MALSGDVTVAEDGPGNVRIHPYLATLVRWCVSYVWSTATVLLHRLLRAQVPKITAPKPRLKQQKSRTAGKDHLDPEPKVECVVLHEPSSPTLDVIFVHGLYGSLGNTWRQGDWRMKYKLDPNVVQLRNHSSKNSCECNNVKTGNMNLNENECEINEDFLTYETDVNESTYENINERLKRILPNENELITEQFYNYALLDNIEGNFETQAEFVQDFYKRSEICDDEMKCNKDDERKNLFECKCKANRRECIVGCGCVCDDCYSLCWPKDWIKMDFPGARVISINYTSDPYLWRPLWVKRTIRLRLHERAEQMMSQLLAMGVGQRPIIWVGHSKGGLFIKQIYCEAFEAHLKASKFNDIKNGLNIKSNTIELKNKNNGYNFNINDSDKSINVKDITLKIDKNNEHKYQIDFTNNIIKQDGENIAIINTNGGEGQMNNYCETKLFNDIKDNILSINSNSFKDNFNKTFNIIRMNCDEFSENLLDVFDENAKLCDERETEFRKFEKKPEENATLSIQDQEVLKTRASLWKSSAGFMFYSVPHRGSPLADIKTPITSRSVELLEISKDCPLVLSLQDRWLMASCPSKPVVRSLVETCRTLMSVLWLRIVSVDSADAGIGELCGVSVDHREICKPSSRKCLLYTQLTDLIHAALNKCKCP